MEKKDDYEINENELVLYIDDFNKFASRKESRKYKNNQKKNKLNLLSKEYLEKKSKRELGFILYKLKKKIIDPSIRYEFLHRMEVRSAEDLIQEIITLAKINQN